MKTKQRTIKNYQLCEEIGKGRASRIYRAIHKPTSKIVAVKVIPQKILSKENGKKHWSSGSEFHCPLKHDNILQCYDFFVDAGYGYLVMEYLDGFNLRQCIQECPLGLSDENERFNHIMNTALKVCEGLIYLHDQKIVHGQIKPENILVSREVIGFSRAHLQVKISDFTMAGMVKGFFRASAHVKGGTLRYMAPEQITKKRATFRSDIFSLGVTFYELFTGHYPWNGNAGRKELLAKLLSSKYRPVPPSQLIPSLPRQLDKIIMAMLEKEEKNRLSTMVEVWLGLSNVETLRI